MELLIAVTDELLKLIGSYKTIKIFRTESHGKLLFMTHNTGCVLDNMPSFGKICERYAILNKNQGHEFRPYQNSFTLELNAGNKIEIEFDNGVNGYWLTLRQL